MNKPLGFYVLIEMDEIENLSAGGIVLATHTEHKREQNACEAGIVIAFGPLAFQGFHNCEGPEDWGVAVGDRVEYERYEGKASQYDKEGKVCELQDRRLRFIPDSKIIGKQE